MKIGGRIGPVTAIPPGAAETDHPKLKKPQTVKLNLRFRHVPDTKGTRLLIQKELEPLREQMDSTASASDYTFAAAWRKVMKSMQRQIQRRLERWETRSLTPSLRRPGLPAASRA